jgi:predicted LPLAT superfamily acyltransferase
VKAEPAPRQEWTTRQERGTAATIKAMVWIALRLGRPATRLLLLPICAYFMAFSPVATKGARDYLARALGRPPGLRDLWRHYHSFASVVLDRVYLLNDQIDLFDLHIEGEEIVQELGQAGESCLLFGAHLGSFEVLRALGRRQSALDVSLVMYEENARKINSALNAINPALAMEVISLGQPTSMLDIARKLEAGGVIGILADRSLTHEEQIKLPFLGAPAAFPVGPFRMAALFRRPVILMVGLYRGGRRYDIHFERLPDLDLGPGRRADALEAGMKAYVERLEHYCRLAPYNWFNFYEFWS